MKPCKGLIEIKCERKAGCLRNLKKDVAPGCMDCPEAMTTIIDLEGKPLFHYKSPPAKTGKRTKK